MNFETFINKVNAVITASKENVKVKFFNDTENGKYTAKLNNGMTIVGNTVSDYVTVKWGSGHIAKATI